MAPPRTAAYHGRYGFRNGCRCDKCVEAERSYQREYKRKKYAESEAYREHVRAQKRAEYHSLDKERRQHRIDRAVAARRIARASDPKYQAWEKAYVQRYGKQRRASRVRFLRALRSTAGCIDCGETEGSLHLDHRPGTVKVNDPARMLTRSWSVLVTEVMKCDVRCPSCHSQRHARERRAQKQQAS